MKKLLFSSFLILNIIIAYSNSAQPGIWEAGGAGTFSLLFPEDSAAYKKIQMAKEVVSIQLYKGFAVVKGEYWMYNTTEDTLIIKAGYPLNSYYFPKQNNNFGEIYFDELYDLKVLVNHEEKHLIQEFIEEKQDYRSEELDNWYVWQNPFPPLDTTKIEVYFMVNTNNSIVREGYSTDPINAFIYLLETGATWKQPILQGDFYIQLMDELNIKDIHGIAASSSLSYDNTLHIIHHSFTQLSPSPDDNLVISYGRQLEKFSFDFFVQNSADYYSKIDKLAKTGSLSPNYKDTEFDDPYSTFSFDVFSILIASIYYLFTYGLPIIGLLILAFILYKLWQKRKASKK